MAAMGEWLRRVRFLVNRRRMEEALRRDMDAHHAMMDEPRRFGNMLRLREHAMDVWGWRWLDEIVYDLRHAARIFVSDRAFALTAVLTLGLAIGPTMAVFAVVNGVMLRPSPSPSCISQLPRTGRRCPTSA